MPCASQATTAANRSVLGPCGHRVNLSLMGRRIVGLDLQQVVAGALNRADDTAVESYDVGDRALAQRVVVGEAQDVGDLALRAFADGTHVLVAFLYGGRRLVPPLAALGG